MRYFSTHLLDSTFTWVSPEILEITGYTDKEIIGLTPYNFFHPEDHNRILKSHVASVGIFDNPMIQKDVVFRWKHKNGNYVWCKSNFTRYKDGIISLTKKMNLFEIILTKIVLFNKKDNEIIITIK